MLTSAPAAHRFVDDLGRFLGLYKGRGVRAPLGKVALAVANK